MERQSKEATKKEIESLTADAAKEVIEKDKRNRQENFKQELLALQKKWRCEIYPVTVVRGKQLLQSDLIIEALP